MTWKIRRLIASFCLASQALAADLPVEFSGVLTDGEKTRFALTDKANGQTTWVDANGELNGYTLGAYDVKQETLTLKKNGEEFPVHLVPAKPADAPAVANATLTSNVAPPTDATAVAIKNNLRQLAVAARQYQLQTGSPVATFADLVGPDKSIKQLNPIDGENYAGLTFGPGAANLSVTTANGITVAIDTAPTVGALSEIAANAAAQPPSMTPTPTGAVAATSTPVATPAPAPVSVGPINTSHVVREGDTFVKIAEAAGVSLQQLQALNPGLNPDSLKVGQPIRIR